MSRPMYGVAAGFTELAEVSSDGFGPVLEGRRSGRRFVIRVLPAVSERSISEETARRLAVPPHPVFLPVEVGGAEEGIYLAAELEGQSLSSALRQCQSGSILPARRCAEVAVELAEAAEAVGRASSGPAARLAPLTWNTTYIDPSGPPWIRLFPPWLFSTGSADWLGHAPADLLFVDRDTLRQAPGPRSDLFSIGAVLLALLKGPAGLPSPEGDAARVIERAVVEGHPLANVRCGGPLDRIVRRALGSGDPFADVAELAAEASAKVIELDPVDRAMAHLRANERFEALAVLHRAAKDGEQSWHLLLLKAELEREEGQLRRAARTLREARTMVTGSGEVSMMLGRLTDDAAEAVDAFRAAVAVDPLDPDVRLELVKALWRAGEPQAAMQVLETVQGLARLVPGCHRQWVEIARFHLQTGNAVAAFRLIEPRLASLADMEVRAGALEVAGAARYEADSYQEAVPLLQEALEIRTRLELEPSAEVFNLLAYALVAVGQRRNAREAALRSLAIDPNQPKISEFLERLEVR